MKLTKKIKPVGPKDLVQYYLKCPSEKNRQRKFTIVMRILRVNGSIEHSTVGQEKINDINKEYRAANYTFNESKKKANSVTRALYQIELLRRGKLIPSDDNRKVQEQYLDKKYPKGKRKEMDFKAVENETTRCLRILGHESLVSITQDKLQACIDKLEPSKQKRYVSRLRSILKVMRISGIKIKFSRIKKKHAPARRQKRN